MRPSAAHNTSDKWITHYFPAPRFAGIPLRLEDEEPQGIDRWGPCKTYAGTSMCLINRDQWVMIDALVRPNDTVLEIGARYGTTSCRLARATKNSGFVVAVDPATTTTQDLLRNRDRHRCNFAAVAGTVASAPMSMGPPSGYDQRTIRARTTGASSPAVTNFAPREIELRLGSSFNVALIDCEGCIESVIEQPELLSQVERTLYDRTSTTQCRHN